MIGSVSCQLVAWEDHQSGRSVGSVGKPNSSSCFYEPRVAIVLKHCQGCMRVHVCVGFVMGRL